MRHHPIGQCRIVARHNTLVGVTHCELWSSASTALMARRPGHTKLHHQPERVHDDAALLDPAFLNAVDDHTPDAYWTPGRGHAEKRSTVRARPFETGQHSV
jgi:hypothetical protein